MPGAGSDTSPFPNSDGQSSDALSNDEAETARNRLTPENESRGEIHSFSLLKILEEDWVKSEIGDPLVAAYHAGRLINAEEWLWLWVSVFGDLQHESLPGMVHAKLIAVAHRIAEPEKCEEVRRTLDFIHTDWNEWSRSEACLIAIESLDETLSSLDSSDRWTKAGQIIRLLENHLEPVQIVAMRLGRSVDQGIRRFRADSRQTSWEFRHAQIDPHEASADLSWLGEVRGICQQNESVRQLLDDIPDVTIGSTPSNYVEVIDEIDRIVRKGLETVNSQVQPQDVPPESQTDDNLFQQKVQRVREVLADIPMASQKEIQKELRKRFGIGMKNETLTDVLDWLRSNGKYSILPRRRSKKGK